MAAIYPVQLSMTRGELTPYVHARADTEHYSLGLAVARNWLVLRYGGITRRPGTFFDNATRDPAKKSELRWFSFNQSQNYALEFGDGYIRFHTVNGRVETAPDVAYEVTGTPWTEADLPNIVTQQAGDVVYIACKGHTIRELHRISETNWQLTLYASEFGPYLAEPTGAYAALYPSSYGSATPIMTSNTTPSGLVTSTFVNADAWRVFDHSDAEFHDGSNNTGAINYTFPLGVTKIVDAYWVKASTGDSPASAPSNWQFQGFDGADWVPLDSRNGERGFTGGETRFYEFQNTTAFGAYRFIWSGSGTTDTADSRIAELGWHESGATQTPFAIYATNTVGINDNVGFVATDAGRYIRLLGSDSRWRNAIIASVVSPTQVMIRLYDHSLPSLAPIVRWQLGAFSTAAENSPSVVSMYENRLALANTAANPLDVWLSKSADFDNMGTTVPVVDDNAVNVRMSNGQLNEVLWMVEAGDMLVGTAGGLRVIGRNDTGKAFSPSNVRQKGQTAVRASGLQPIVIERTVLFAELHKKSLYESAFSYEADGYVALELTMLAEHIFAHGIKQMAYQDSPSKALWVVLTNGEMAVCTYDREQKVFGVSPADTDGEYESVVVLPGAEYDVPMFIVKRGERRDIERMADPFRVGLSSYGIPVYFDGCSIYQGAPTNNLTNLTQLAGMTVGYWADGADRGNVTVTAGGVVTLPTTYSNIVIGRRYTSRGQTLRLSQANNGDGGIMGRKARVIEGYLDIMETFGLKAGSYSAYERGELEDMVSTEHAELRPVVPALHTGFVKMHTDDTWQGNGVYVFETDKGYPATIRSIMTSVETEP